MVPIFLFGDFAFKVYKADKCCAYFWLTVSFLQFFPVFFRWAIPLSPNMIFYTFLVVTYVCPDVKPLKYLIRLKIFPTLWKASASGVVKKNHTLLFIFLWSLVSNFGGGISLTTRNGLKCCSYSLDSITFDFQPVLLNLQTWQPILGGVPGHKPLGGGRQSIIFSWQLGWGRLIFSCR